MRNGPKQHENNVAALSCRTENPPLRCERVVSACGSAATLNLAFSPFLPMALNLRTRRVTHVVGLQPPDQRPAIGDRRAKKRGRKCVKDAVPLSAGPNQTNKNVKMCVHNTFIPREPADERRTTPTGSRPSAAASTSSCRLRPATADTGATVFARGRGST